MDHGPTDDDATIPELLPPERMPPVECPADLHRTWRALMGELGFGGHTIWTLLLDPDGRILQLIQMVEADRVPDLDEADNFAGVCAEVTGWLPGSSVAVLLTRPGGASLTRWDRLAAERLLDALVLRGLARFPLHRANDEILVPITPDDLLGAVPAA